MLPTGVCVCVRVCVHDCAGGGSGRGGALTGLTLLVSSSILPSLKRIVFDRGIGIVNMRARSILQRLPCLFVRLWTEQSLLSIFHNISYIHLLFLHFINQLHKVEIFIFVDFFLLHKLEQHLPAYLYVILHKDFSLNRGILSVIHTSVSKWQNQQCSQCLELWFRQWLSPWIFQLNIQIAVSRELVAWSTCK